MFSVLIVAVYAQILISRTRYSVVFLKKYTTLQQVYYDSGIDKNKPQYFGFKLLHLVSDA